jgi:lambda repressor-like predicted transcriptional regulator
MSISEADRHQLVRLLSEAITPKGAALLMEHLPGVGWADVATKRDLDALAALTKRDLDAHAALTKKDLDAHAALTKKDLDAHARSFAAALQQQGASLRAEMAEQGSSLRAEMAEQGASLRAEVAEQGASLHAEMAEQGASLRSYIAVLAERFEATDAKIDASRYEVLATLRQDMLLQTRTFVLANVAGIFTAVGLAFAAAKLV